LYEQKDLKHSSALNTVSAEEIKKKKTARLVLIVQFTTLSTENSFTRQLPALHYNCVLTPAVTTDAYKQHITACPLFPAEEVRIALLANSAISSTFFQRLWPQKIVPNCRLNLY